MLDQERNEMLDALVLRDRPPILLELAPSLMREMRASVPPPLALINASEAKFSGVPFRVNLELEGQEKRFRFFYEDAAVEEILEIFKDWPAKCLALLEGEPPS